MATKSYELELHESKNTSTRLTEIVTGYHRFKIVGYSWEKGMGVGNCLTSRVFTVGGYEWVIEYYPDGYTEDDKDYLSFYLSLKGEGEEVKAQFEFTVLDRKGRSSTLYFITPKVTFGGNQKRWGRRKFVERKIFERSGYIRNDSFTIVCTIAIAKPSRFTKYEPVMEPPPNVHQQLCHLLKRGRGADVTFEVGGETFKAHKCVLVARSPVFDAQFFGSIKWKEAEILKLDDIEPEVFRVLLHFVYSDSLPEFDDKQLDPVILHQHLLVAADRFEVHGLRLICKQELSKNIEVEHLATSLTLAEQHYCSVLKTSCFNFVSSSEILAGYKHMAQSFPNLPVELTKNLRNFQS
ncbi:hypothetical protein LUZ60_008734 [Juncus effusus]|nr:hypothetical protein LUZ60_008734 [Juncus effusus]